MTTSTLLPTRDTSRFLDSIESLYRYLGSPRPSCPAILNRAELDQLDKAARERYDESRLLYLSAGMMIGTPELRKARNLLTQTYTYNRGKCSDSGGVMISGDATLGKTTVAKSMLEYVYHRYLREHPTFLADGRLPVMYVRVPTNATAKLLMQSFADVLGLTVTPRESSGRIQARVVQSLIRSDTRLVVLDDLQFLLGSGAGKNDTADLLKSLSDAVPATFVYAGIDLTDSKLLTGTRGQQLAGRCVLLELSRLDINDPIDRTHWRSIVNYFDAHMPLAEHIDGDLRKMQDYLFERTGGSIGSLSRLLIGAAALAIGPDHSIERLTTDLMEDVCLDIAAEKGRAARKRRQKTSKARAVMSAA